MAHQVRWNNELLSLFIKLGELTPRETRVLRLRVVEDMSIIEQAAEMMCSESTINRVTNRLKKKYDSLVKQYPSIFPEREKENVWK